eukprot:CAMPEP_0184680494 /NCGR_PEP_ID=MMETSP0312-20130426/3375_1 /TAXON_ID=31354 /ORGANISM="Compsopogon coeruleus, Strain SAG 36.94" /LENGTH=358 /DNA_ID=CAMNT_0027130635 /DNA_START=890 /DNA_END=1966 /DNA_ORIENTATION=+
MPRPQTSSPSRRSPNRCPPLPGTPRRRGVTESTGPPRSSHLRFTAPSDDYNLPTTLHSDGPPAKRRLFAVVEDQASCDTGFGADFGSGRTRAFGAESPVTKSETGHFQHLCHSPNHIDDDNGYENSNNRALSSLSNAAWGCGPLDQHIEAELSSIPTSQRESSAADEWDLVLQTVRPVDTAWLCRSVRDRLGPVSGLLLLCGDGFPAEITPGALVKARSAFEEIPAPQFASMIGAVSIVLVSRVQMCSSTTVPSAAQLVCLDPPGRRRTWRATDLRRVRLLRISLSCSIRRLWFETPAEEILLVERPLQDKAWSSRALNPTGAHNSSVHPDHQWEEGVEYDITGLRPLGRIGPLQQET